MNSSTHMCRNFYAMDKIIGSHGVSVFIALGVVQWNTDLYSPRCVSGEVVFSCTLVYPAAKGWTLPVVKSFATHRFPSF